MNTLLDFLKSTFWVQYLQFDIDLTKSKQEDVETLAAMCAQVCRDREACVASLGVVGVGKTSHVNSILSALTGFIQVCGGTGAATDSRTKEPHCHSLKHRTNPENRMPMLADMNAKWWDTAGHRFRALVESGSLVKRSGDRYDVEYQKLLYKQRDWLRSKNIDCVVMIMACTHLVEPATRALNHLKVLKHLYDLLNDEMRVFCILSHADAVDRYVDPAAGGNVANIVYSRKVHILRQRVKVYSGLPLEQIFPVVNLVNGAAPKRNPAVCHLLLHVLYTVLSSAQHMPVRKPQAAPDTAPQPLLEGSSVHLTAPATEAAHLAALLEPPADVAYVSVYSSEWTEWGSAAAPSEVDTVGHSGGALYDSEPSAAGSQGNVQDDRGSSSLCSVTTSSLAFTSDMESDSEVLSSTS